MGKKNKDSKPKDFNNNPFKSLKGLSVSAPEEKVDPEAKPAPKAEPPHPKGADRDNLDFLEAMAELGVEGERKHGVKAPKLAPVAPEEPEEDAEALMLEALGHMDVCFVDNFPVEDSGQRAHPRRMKQVEKGQVAIDGECDLHGTYADEVEQKVTWFLEDARHRGWKVVRIITGAGHSSVDGPVLRPRVEQFLSSAAGHQWIVEWGRAPKRLGGDGALIVFLRK
ncbi:MAG: hypothetical protein C0624_08170 [Desulfuromonas sp.]|nr:MAG: hypothetical protein C0624_08170 [Desulfuromonas sp.]